MLGLYNGLFQLRRCSFLSSNLNIRLPVRDQHLATKIKKMECKDRTSARQHGLPRAHNSHRPSRPNTSKLEHCLPCKKSFKEKKDLDQHLRDSMTHKSTNAVSPWSVLPDSEHKLRYQELCSHCNLPDHLIRNKYVMAPYTETELAGLRKCNNCGRLAKDIQNIPCCFHHGKAKITPVDGKRRYSCCGKVSRNQYCVSQPDHDLRVVHHAIKLRTFANSPTPSVQTPKHSAIVLDCEMARTKGPMGLMNEVIQVCAVNYLTGEIVLNRLVLPEGRVHKLGTEIHGITANAMSIAASQGQLLSGWRAARAELWKLIDTDTVLIGHSMNYDLDVLRMIHTRIVDSAILTRNAVGPHRQWGLQTLSRELLGVEIRKNEGGVHDCTEDVLATREVVLWCTRNQAEFASWAATKQQTSTLPPSSSILSSPVAAS
ncbi:ribonuclease H-like domain-containing protein [Phaeosphaeria sp. MPI-PUGE-AT-0046c]|nr:ribonuclease H-like domain-containing protein [Phaeosphaeria sp. MPI-PUGE-AT-0046c]